MSDFADNERLPIFPVYIVIDVSYSMEGAPINAVNNALPELKTMISNNASVGEVARIAILTFSDYARPVVPLCDLQNAPLPTLKPEGNTNFAEAFRTLHAELEQGIRSFGKGVRFYKPVVFFMSDGEHNAGEDWRPPLRKLEDRNFNFNPEIVTFGFGDADPESLQQIATTYAFAAKSGNPTSQVKEIMNALLKSVRTTSNKLAQGNESALSVEPDPEQFTRLGIRQAD